ncbi:arsenical resistance transcriptional repressor [Raoultella ornithinolytica]|uniref:DUF1833 family protein n=1 Tax=Raoultella ornithinolytica TaxID=54291 RepID=UPI0007CCAB73|nr:DUF1833 family protein [Raoultella ornithinolytica]QJJ95363.1 DUF1833 family protein [Klebsiella pneumoniae]SBL23331.1 arsenical resistance transcriptional repressor [Raoultella ornithinolytica]
MEILERLYASSGSEVIHDTLQISTGEENFWLTQGYDDITVILESGQTATFEACEVSIALPARNADGTQDLQFAISNIDGVVSGAIDKILDQLKSAKLTFRRYISTDLSAPAAAPYTLDIKNGSWTPAAVQITAGYMNILDTAWPRNRYNLADHPGLRYLS